MKKNRIVFLMWLFFMTLGYPATPVQRKAEIRKVIIDAGHGGHDPGTVGKRSKEKDIALAVALKLGALIQENEPGIEVVYTRRTDVFVELYRRAQIANESKADLFISIHCNGTKNPSAHGVETWVMGLHKSKENLEVAKKENASILLEDNYSKYDGFDPNSPEANIIFSLFQNLYLDQSLDIANRIQQQFSKSLGLVDRGVKQAGFWVLYKTTMPGILVETGFLSNPVDEAYLISDKGQNLISEAIYNAFKEYKNANSSPATTTSPIPPSTTDPVVYKPVVKNEPPVTKEEPKVVEKVVYKVQIATSGHKLPANHPPFRGVQPVSMYFHMKAYKYTVGNCESMEQAVKLQADMKQQGFSDAFVVAFYKNERISKEEATRISGN